MHLLLLTTALVIAYSIRLMSQQNVTKYDKRWGLSSFFFAFPPLILLMTCLTITLMGYQGEMWGIKASKFSYYLALSYLLVAIITLWKQFFNLYKLQQLVKGYPTQNINNQKIKILDSSFPYASQVGFWRSQLVISTGLIYLLSEEHLQAVIAHEKAHEIHKDTFIFFWLSYLERLTFWLPNNQKLWRNLLLLRELRADQTAAQTVDFLLIAESLIQVTAATAKEKETLQLAFECPFNDNRLEERINNLLDEHKPLKFNWWQIIWLVLIFIPYTFVPFHITC